jgi:hypothetical protein
MPLPHYSNPLFNSITKVEPIYTNLFEFVLVTENYHIKELSYELSYINTLNENKINVRFTIDSIHFKYLNFDNFLKDIKYVIHSSYDKSGNVIGQFLIGVRFINSEINFTHNDSKILEVNLKLENISCEEIDFPVTDGYIRSIQRNFKIDNLI